MYDFVDSVFFNEMLVSRRQSVWITVGVTSLQFFFRAMKQTVLHTINDSNQYDPVMATYSRWHSQYHILSIVLSYRLIVSQCSAWTLAISYQDF